MIVLSYACDGLLYISPGLGLVLSNSTFLSTRDNTRDLKPSQTHRQSSTIRCYDLMAGWSQLCTLTSVNWSIYDTFDQLSPVPTD